MSSARFTIKRVYDTVDPAGRRALFLSENDDPSTEREIVQYQGSSEMIPETLELYETMFDWSVRCKAISETEDVTDVDKIGMGYVDIFPSDLTFVTLYAERLVEQNSDDPDYRVDISIEDPGDYYIPVVYDAGKEFYYAPGEEEVFRWRALDLPHTKYWNRGQKNIYLKNNCANGGVAKIGVRAPTDPGYLDKFFGKTGCPYYGLYVEDTVIGDHVIVAAHASKCVPGWGEAIDTKECFNIHVKFGIYLPFKQMDGFSFVGAGPVYGYNTEHIPGRYYNPGDYEGTSESPEEVINCSFKNCDVMLRNTRRIVNCRFENTGQVFASFKMGEGIPEKTDDKTVGTRFSDLSGYIDRCHFSKCKGAQPIVYAARVSNCIFYANECGFPARGFVVNCAFVGNKHTYLWDETPARYYAYRTVVANSYLYNNWFDYGEYAWRASNQEDYLVWKNKEQVAVKRGVQNLYLRRCVYDNWSYGITPTFQKVNYLLNKTIEYGRIGLGGLTNHSCCINVGDDRKLVTVARYNAVSSTPHYNTPGKDPVEITPNQAINLLFCRGETIAELKSLYEDLKDIGDEWNVDSAIDFDYFGNSRESVVPSIGPIESSVGSLSVVKVYVVTGFGSASPRVYTYAKGSDAKITVVGDVDDVEVNGERVGPARNITFKTVAGVNIVRIWTKRELTVDDSRNGNNANYGSSDKPLKTINKALARGSDMVFVDSNDFESCQASVDEKYEPFTVHSYGINNEDISTSTDVESVHIHFNGSKNIKSLEWLGKAALYADGNARLSGTVTTGDYDDYVPLVLSGFMLLPGFCGNKKFKFVNCTADFSGGSEMLFDGTYYLCDIKPSFKGHIDGVYVASRIHEQAIPEWADGVLVGSGKFKCCRIDKCRKLGASPSFDRCFFTSSYNYTTTGSTDGKVYGNGDNEFDPYYRVVYPGSHQSSDNGDKEKIMTRNKRTRTSEVGSSASNKSQYIVPIQNTPDIGDRAALRRLHDVETVDTVFDRPPIERPDWSTPHIYTDFESIGFPADTTTLSMHPQQQQFLVDSGFKNIAVSDRNFVRAVSAVMYYLASVEGRTDVSHMYDYINKLVYVSLRSISTLTSSLEDIAILYVNKDQQDSVKNGLVSDLVRVSSVVDSGDNIAIPFNFSTDEIDSARDAVEDGSFEKEFVVVDDVAYFTDSKPGTAGSVTATAFVADCLNDLRVTRDMITVDGVQAYGIKMPKDWVSRGKPVWTIGV